MTQDSSENKLKSIVGYDSDLEEGELEASSSDTTYSEAEKSNTLNEFDQFKEGVQV